MSSRQSQPDDDQNSGDVHPHAYPGKPAIDDESVKERLKAHSEPYDPNEHHVEHGYPIEGECLIWMLSRNPDGYGWFSHNGRMKRAHRISWRTHCGAIPDGYVLTHSCHVRCCINPEHLVPDTQSNNMTAASKQGELGRNPEVVKEIVNRYFDGETPIELASEYECARRTVWKYIRQERYSYLELSDKSDE